MLLQIKYSTRIVKPLKSTKLEPKILFLLQFVDSMVRIFSFNFFFLVFSLLLLLINLGFLNWRYCFRLWTN